MREKILGDGVIGQARRFVLVGISNAAITYAIYLVMLRSVSATLAFAIAIVVAVVYTTVLNTTLVFKSEMTIENFVVTVLYQLVYSLANIGVFKLFVIILPLPLWLTPVAVMSVLVPIHFICSKLLALGSPLVRRY